MDGSLRSFRASDRETALELSRRALAREEEQVGSPLWSSLAEVDAELGSLEAPATETLRVIDDEGRPAAFGGVELEDEAVVFGPLVAPAVRGRKFGTLLLDASLELAREHGVERLSASVGAHNAGGRLLLERSGFRRLGGLRAVYRLLPGRHRPVAVPKRGVATRPAEAHDVEPVLELCHACFVGSTVSDDSWRRGIDRGHVRLAEEGGRPVALVRIDPARRRVFHCVAEDARARGIGGFVLSEVLEGYWESHPDEPLRLAAPAENLSAARLYRRQGFAPWLLLQPYELPL